MAGPADYRRLIVSHGAPKFWHWLIQLPQADWHVNWLCNTLWQWCGAFISQASCDSS